MQIQTVAMQTTAKSIVKKSSFFSYVYPFSSEKELKPILEKLSKEHKKASHVAFAYRIAQLNVLGDLVYNERRSDDGEPSKTAGAPLLRLLQQKELGNVLVCAARVFGGIKLGPAGLIKAYRTSGKMALEENTIILQEINQ